MAATGGARFTLFGCRTSLLAFTFARFTPATARTVFSDPHVETIYGELVATSAMGCVGVIVLVSVGFAGERLEVRWIDAASGLAFMMQIEIRLKWAVIQAVKKTMNFEVLAIQSDLSITIAIDATAPEPAT